MNMIPSQTLVRMGVGPLSGQKRVGEDACQLQDPNTRSICTCKRTSTLEPPLPRSLFNRSIASLIVVRAVIVCALAWETLLPCAESVLRRTGSVGVCSFRHARLDCVPWLLPLPLT
jgi:hypothetical protein